MATENPIGRTIGMVILAILAMGCLLVLRPFFTAVFFALILVVATWPAFDHLQHLLGGRRTLAALVLVALATLVFVVPPALVASSVDYNLAGAVRLLDDLAQHGMPAAAGLGRRGGRDRPGPACPVARICCRRARGGRAHPGARRLGRAGLISAGLNLGSAIVQLILAMLTAFVLYRDGVAARRSLIAAGRRIAGAHTPRLLRVASATINGAVYGVLGTSLIQALLLLAGLWIVGIPGALLLGLLIFVHALIPFGPLLIWGPAAVWLYLEGHTGAAAFIVVWSIAADFLTDNVLRPFLISRGSDLPLILIVFGVVGGVVTFGFLGLFLGPTLLAVGYELIREWSAVRAEASDAVQEDAA